LISLEYILREEKEKYCGILKEKKQIAEKIILKERELFSSFSLYGLNYHIPYGKRK